MKDEKNNTGEENTGDWNSGYRNSGDWNSGDRNSGDRNSGDRNSGYGNSGYRNSGDRNSGDRNSGYGNSTNRESGVFCNQEGEVRMFNKPTNKKWGDIKHPHFNEFYLTKWIPEIEMTDEEKKDDPEFHVREGYLKTFEYKEAWLNFWNETSEENKQTFKGLPNFDAEVFEDITGINVNESDIEITVKINGKESKLSDISEETLKKLRGL